MTSTPGPAQNTSDSHDVAAGPPLPRVGFIGLGNMGLPMAVNLVQAGIHVTGFDLVPEAIEKAEAQGIVVTETGEEAIATADIVLTMLPSGQHVLTAYTGAENTGGLLAAAQPGATFLDCSTINISEAQQAAALAEQAGFSAADAPVSGGVVGAEAGTLAFMVGASEETFTTVRPILDIMGGRVVHCGGPGLGQTAKICNNMILGISMIAVSEAFVLAEKMGLSHEAMFDVASRATGQCWSLTTNCPVPGPVPTSPANRDFQPGFATALMAKDLGLATTAVEENNVEARLGQVAADMYRTLAETEAAGQDFSAIINQIRDRSA